MRNGHGSKNLATFNSSDINNINNINSYNIHSQYLGQGFWSQVSSIQRNSMKKSKSQDESKCIFHNNEHKKLSDAQEEKKQENGNKNQNENQSE